MGEVKEKCFGVTGKVLVENVNREIKSWWKGELSVYLGRG